jgi:retron-type reverse transcriptase
VYVLVPQSLRDQEAPFIYEPDFLNGSFEGRPGRSAHHALAALNKIIAGKKVSFVLEADLRNFFGSLDHT